MKYEVKGDGLDKAAVEKAVKMAEEKYCPVWAMLRNSVAVTWECSVL